MIANHIGQDTRAVEHRAGLRAADDGLSRNQFLDGLQLAHLVAERRIRRCRTRCTRRWPSTTLFENRGSLRNMSILDRVKDEAASLSKKISSSDKAKLDEYLTSVREVETARRAHAQEQGQRRDLAKQKNRPVFTMDRPANGLPEDLREHAAPDVRHHRHRVPDGQDARRLAAAGPRSFGALLSVPGRQQRPSRAPRTTTPSTATNASRGST